MIKTFSAILLAAALANRLPTGAQLDPVAPASPLGNFPLALVASPDGKQLVALLCGWRQQGLQVIDSATGSVTQTIDQPAAFLGIAFSPDGKTLYTSGSNDDNIHVYRWENGSATADGTILFGPPKKNPKDDAEDFPAGLAVSKDGRFLYVAQNVSDGLAVVDLARRVVVQRLNTDRYPYAVAADANRVYVSAWGAATVNVFAVGGDGLLKRRPSIAVSRHPSSMLLRSSRLYVTSAASNQVSIVDTAAGKVVNTLMDSAPAGPSEGSTPNALELSSDGKRLFVAEADNNAVAVFDVATRRLLGRIPTEWYPSALVRAGKTIYVANAKGHGTAPNPGRTQPTQKLPAKSHDYTLGQLDGSVLSFPENISGLEALSQRVATANGWNAARSAPKYPPFKHVIYIIKENRTYDQVFGDMAEGDGDKSLLFFDETSAPNHHALARRFGLFDRFFVNAEVSATGHNWSTAAYASDYVEKTVQSSYSNRRKDYDYEGANRGHMVNDEDDVNAPSTGYLWDLAARKKISMRDYGEFTVGGEEIGQPAIAAIGMKSALRSTTSPTYPGWNLDIRDQKRADAWLAEFNAYVAGNNLPALEIMRLPNDHTSGTQANKPTPRAYMADNDLALGRIVDALSHSPYWRDTVMFVLEDDAQSGPDHVDSHRSVLLVLSAYSRGGVIHRFVNTTDVIRTIEEILGLDALSQFDYYGRPLRDVFGPAADLTPYTTLKPSADLNEMNPPGPAAASSAKLDFSKPDAIDDDTFNRILWSAIKPEVPYPGATRAPVKEFVGN